MKPSSSGVLFAEFFDYCFIFTSCILPIQILWFFLIQCWKFIYFEKFIHFIQIIPFLAYIVVLNIFLQSFVFLWCQLLLLLFYFLIYVIWVPSLYYHFFMSLVKCLSILFTFSINQLLVSLIFLYCFCRLFCLFLLWSLLFMFFYSLSLFHILFQVSVSTKLGVLNLSFFFFLKVSL